MSATDFKALRDEMVREFLAGLPGASLKDMDSKKPEEIEG